MSTLAVPGAFTSANTGAHLLPEFAGHVPAGEPRRPPATVRRRANSQQGHALEIVGHAIEFLVDSRLFMLSGLDERAEQEAVQILMRASRAIFAECAEIVPLRQQLGDWLVQRLPWIA